MLDKLESLYIGPKYLPFGGGVSNSHSEFEKAQPRFEQISTRASTFGSQATLVKVLTFGGGSFYR